MTRFIVPPFQFVQPLAQLHPYLKEAVRDLEEHGFAIISAQLIVDRTICTDAQIEMLREAVRKISIEKDRNLTVGMIGELSESALTYLAALTEQTYEDGDYAILLDRKGGAGTLPEAYVEDKDGHGVLEETGQTIPIKAE